MQQLRLDARLRAGLPFPIPMTQSSGAPNAARFPMWLIVCGALTTIGPFSIDMYLPSFPALAADLGTDIGRVQLTVGTFLVGLACGQAFYGPLSDRFGRKPPLYAGLALYVIASLGCALAPTVDSLMLWRLVQALGGCAGMVVARASIRDRLDARASAGAFSAMMLVMGLAPILAPMIGGAVLAAFGWRAIFWLLVIVGLLILALVHWRMEESLDPSRAAPLHMGFVLRTYWSLLRDREFLGYALAAGFAQGGMFAYIAGSPFVLIELHGIPPQYYGFVFGANALGLIAMSQVNGKLVRTRAIDHVLRVALVAPAAAGLGLAAAALAGGATLPVLLAGLWIYMAALGCVMPNASAVALAHQGHRAGSASALLGTLQFGVGTLAGAAVSVWRDGTALPLAVVMAVCGTGAVLWRLYGVAGARQADAATAAETQPGQ